MSIRYESGEGPRRGINLATLNPILRQAQVVVNPNAMNEARAEAYLQSQTNAERTRKRQQQIIEEVLSKAAVFKAKAETEGLSDAERLEAENVFQQAERLQSMTGPSFRRDAESLQRVPEFKRGAESLQRVPEFKRGAESLQIDPRILERGPGSKRGPDDYIILYGDFSELQVKVNESIAAGYYPIGNITIYNDAYYQSMVRKAIMKGGKRKTRKVKKNY